MTACGSDKAPDSSGQAAGGAAPAATTGTASNRRCPLTAEQVGAELGTPVKADGSCIFFPADESKAWPNAVFVRQASIACSPDMLAELGLKEKVDGLGHPAYTANQADGFRLLVCHPEGPFEMKVDAPDEKKARAAAISLARTVLAAR
jgi:hypothetical protein